jgi:hypothetical protein
MLDLVFIIYCEYFKLTSSFPAMSVFMRAPVEPCCTAPSKDEFKDEVFNWKDVWIGLIGTPRIYWISLCSIHNEKRLATCLHEYKRLHRISGRPFAYLEGWQDFGKPVTRKSILVFLFCKKFLGIALLGGYFLHLRNHFRFRCEKNHWLARLCPFPVLKSSILRNST